MQQINKPVKYELNKWDELIVHYGDEQHRLRNLTNKDDVTDTHIRIIGMRFNIHFNEAKQILINWVISDE